jgi:hypothetical protein
VRTKRISLRAVALVVICAAVSAFGADREFRGVVNAIEANYGVHHLHIPLLGFALFFARAEGASGVKLAVFDNFPAPAASVEISRIVEKSLGPGWYPFVRVRSQADRETTLIYTNPSTGKMRLMVVNIEPSEATVVELSLSERDIKKWLKEPGEQAAGQSGNR